MKRRKKILTYRLALVPDDQPPVVGEIRYVIDWVSNPAEPLAQMLPTEKRMIWTGKKWVECASHL